MSDSHSKHEYYDAGNREHVKQSKLHSKFRRKQELADLAFVLSSREGRRFMWRILTHCKVYQSIWEPSAKIHYNAGRQDVGHYLQSEILSADPQAYIKMINEEPEREPLSED